MGFTPRGTGGVLIIPDNQPLPRMEEPLQTNGWQMWKWRGASCHLASGPPAPLPNPPPVPDSWRSIGKALQKTERSEHLGINGLCMLKLGFSLCLPVDVWDWVLYWCARECPTDPNGTLGRRVPEKGERCSYSPSERRLGLSGLLLFTLQSPSPPHKQRLSTSLRSWEQWGSPEYLPSFEPHSSTGHLYCPRQLPPLQRGNPRQEWTGRQGSLGGSAFCPLASGNYMRSLSCETRGSQGPIRFCGKEAQRRAGARGCAALGGASGNRWARRRSLAGDKRWGLSQAISGTGDVQRQEKAKASKATQALRNLLHFSSSGALTSVHREIEAVQYNLMANS